MTRQLLVHFYSPPYHRCSALRTDCIAFAAPVDISAADRACGMCSESCAVRQHCTRLFARATSSQAREARVPPAHTSTLRSARPACTRTQQQRQRSRPPQSAQRCRSIWGIGCARWRNRVRMDMLCNPRGRSLFETQNLRCVCYGRAGTWNGGRTAAGERVGARGTCSAGPDVQGTFLIRSHYRRSVRAPQDQSPRRSNSMTAGQTSGQTPTELRVGVGVGMYVLKRIGRNARE